jgi:hypothetical protein
MVAMREFRLRQDLERRRVGAFALPLGVEPEGLPEPTQGYTLRYEEGDDDTPDTYSFHVVVSHERIKEVIDAAFGLLPDEVLPVVEIGSRDAYRSVDVYLAEEAIPLDDFLRVWYEFEDIILEDVCIGAGANAEDPFIEIFVDSWKGVAIHVPVEWRERIETLLAQIGLEEVPETWPEGLDKEGEPLSKIREVLAIEDEHSPDLDEVLLQLRDAWDLSLDVDPDSNLDDAGRELGKTLWHVIVMAEPTEGDPEAGAYVSFWITAGSIAEVEEIIDEWFDGQDDWSFKSVYSLDRVAFDERPEELGALPHRRTRNELHLVHVDRWGDVPPPGSDGARDGSGSRER